MTRTAADSPSPSLPPKIQQSIHPREHNAILLVLVLQSYTYAQKQKVFDCGYYMLRLRYVGKMLNLIRVCVVIEGRKCMNQRM